MYSAALALPSGGNPLRYAIAQGIENGWPTFSSKLLGRAVHTTTSSFCSLAQMPIFIDVSSFGRGLARTRLPVSVQADFAKLPADFINDGAGTPSR